MSAEDNVEMINNEEDIQMNQNPNNVPVMVQNQNIQGNVPKAYLKTS